MMPSSVKVMNWCLSMSNVPLPSAQVYVVWMSRLIPPDRAWAEWANANTVTSSSNVPDGHKGSVAVNVNTPAAKSVCSLMVNGTVSAGMRRFGDHEQGQQTHDCGA